MGKSQKKKPAPKAAHKTSAKPAPKAPASKGLSKGLSKKPKVILKPAAGRGKPVAAPAKMASQKPAAKPVAKAAVKPGQKVLGSGKPAQKIEHGKANIKAKPHETSATKQDGRDKKLDKHPERHSEKQDQHKNSSKVQAKGTAAKSGSHQESKSQSGRTQHDNKKGGSAMAASAKDAGAQGVAKTASSIPGGEGKKLAGKGDVGKSAKPLTKAPKKNVKKKDESEIEDDFLEADDLGGSEIDEYAEELEVVESFSETDDDDLIWDELDKDRSADEVALTDAEGRRFCRHKDCDQLASVESYCRYHYLLLWRKIQNRKKILIDGKLERYVEELTARYPDKFIEMIKRDLRTEKDFLSAIQELELDDSADSDFEEEAESFIDEVRGMNESAAVGGVDEEEF